jgi:glycerol-3-phosphate acyltransferase PlsX
LIAARATFGLLPGVERPALAVVVPTRRGPAVLLDAGANVDCRASHLAQFGIMGAACAQVLLKVAEPRVGLLSNGEEAGKGNEATREAHAALVASPIKFIGNVDAAQWFEGMADVVVCDGFVGNIALKVGEAVIDLVAAELAGTSLAAFDHATAGGAPLIGVNGLIVVGHGRATPQAVANGIALTARLAQGGMVTQVAEAVGRVLK